MTGLTHINAKGEAHMVDVSSKPATDRIAIAVVSIQMQPETLQLVIDGNHKKATCWV